MPKKSVREMNFFQRLNHSLGAKIFRAVLVFAVILGAAAITIGFRLYTDAVNREYRSQTWNIARTSALILNEDEVRIVSKRILAVYDSLPAAENEVWDESQTEAYSEAMDYLYLHVKETLKGIRDECDVNSLYIGTVDDELGRLIYITDPGELIREGVVECPPGKWDNISQEEASTYLNGNTVSRFDRIFGNTTPIPAAITTTDEYGYLCTAAAPFMEVEGHQIFVFCDMDMNHVAQISRSFLIQYILVLLAAAVILSILISRHLRKIVVKPVNKLADAASAYKSDMKNTGRCFVDLDIHTGDELEALSLTMKDMEADTVKYVHDLTAARVENERISTELDVASTIQEGMIPHIFPAFPDRSEFDIYATMTPAKEVGGDFYDYFLIDDDHLAMVIADVSGKGIPAALFMMASKIIINNFCRLKKGSPADILAEVNAQICSDNEAEMFVTVWLGIFEISTGILKAANAGHEYPAVKRADGSFELYKDKHGFVIGGMDGVRYQEYEIKFEKGDMLFQYTDGVTEATDKDNNLFGTGRMIDALNEAGDCAPDEVLKTVKKSIDGFVQDADQFDDITMLCFKYLG